MKIKDWEIAGSMLACVMDVWVYCRDCLKKLEVTPDILVWLKTDDGQTALKEGVSMVVAAFKKQSELVADFGFVHGKESLPDDLIQINRTTPLPHSEWVKEALYNESVGPANIDPAKVEQWLHHDQKTGLVTGTVIHDHLVQNQMIESCYGLRELLAIQARGIGYFRKHWKGKTVFGWKGAVRPRGGGLYVPCLCDVGDGVVLHWFWLDGVWHSRNPALRVASGS